MGLIIKYSKFFESKKTEYTNISNKKLDIDTIDISDNELKIAKDKLKSKERKVFVRMTKSAKFQNIICISFNKQVKNEDLINDYKFTILLSKMDDGYYQLLISCRIENKKPKIEKYLIDNDYIEIIEDLDEFINNNEVDFIKKDLSY